MKLYGLLHKALAFGVLLSAAAAGGGEISLHLTDPQPTGTVVAMVFDSATAFVALDTPLASTTVRPGEELPIRFTDLPAGAYAVTLYEDKNANGRLDRNFIGIPREPLGFSNGYWPHGPPTFERAAFNLGADESRIMEVRLRSVFAKRGLVGIGAGFVSQSSPYRGHRGTTVQPIPLISYIGERLQVLGPSASYGVLSWSNISVAVSTTYRLGVYEDDDSDYLRGLGDREATIMVGPAVRVRLAHRADLKLAYERDVLGRNHGAVGRVEIDKSFQAGRVTLSPQAGFRWLDEKLAAYEYGVPTSKGTPERPAYRPGSALNPYAGFGIFFDAGWEWNVILNVKVELLAHDLTASPIVDKDHVISLFGGIARSF